MAATGSIAMVMVTAITTIIMAEPDRLLRLFTWLSPAFPIGGFAYSQGLETAISEQRVTDPETLAGWIAGQLHLGFLRTDAYFLAIAARAVGNGDSAGFNDAAELALALQVSAERHLETTEQGRSFIVAASTWPVPMPDWLSDALARSVALPVAFGAIAAAHGVETRSALLGFINAAIGQQISVAVRLVPLGQTQGLAVQAQLEPLAAALADDALAATLNDIAGIGYGTDIASLRHEDLNVRIFRS